MIMEEPTLRRIAVDREVDWLTVQDNVSRGLQSSLDARLATLPGGRDGPAAKGVRRELEERIKKIREQAFLLAKPNLRVNGHNYEDFVESTEPFDEVMDRNLKGLRAERLSSEAAVVEARRTLPGKINRMSNYIEKVKTAGEWLPADEIPEDESRVKEIAKPERYQETVDTFTTVAANLSELAQTAPAQLTRATRAHGVREEIANMGP